MKNFKIGSFKIGKINTLFCGALVLLSFSATAAQARFKSAGAIVTKLGIYDEAYFSKAVVAPTEEELADQKVEVSPAEPDVVSNTMKSIDPKQLDRALDDLQSAVDFAMKQKKVAPAAALAILQLAARTMNYDPTVYAAEIIEPLYSKHKNQFDELIAELKPADSKLVKQTIKDRIREMKSGNG